MNCYFIRDIIVLIQSVDGNRPFIFNIHIFLLKIDWRSHNFNQNYPTRRSDLLRAIIDLIAFSKLSRLDRIINLVKTSLSVNLLQESNHNNTFAYPLD
ncbi:MAG: hypothetical protein FKGGLIKP_00607 [Sodalis sp. Fse]|nr:MAG: hypothetical protein FKGGLIKP_00607 [Sodalis sp. Fse]UVK79383.1 MAG: hypothetical protein IGNPGNKH_00879 [Sodalis sp. Ffu]